MNIENLHHQIQTQVKNLKACEARLLDLLEEMDRQKGFISLGFASLFEYCTFGLGLSESQASAFISVQRKSQEVPALKAALQSGELSVSKAKRITRVLHPGNASHWIEKAKMLNQREMEYEIARVAPQIFVSERKERLSEKIFRLTIALKEETIQRLETAKDLLEKDSYESTFEEVLKFFLERKDPLLKAKRLYKKEKETPAKSVFFSFISALNQHSSRNVQKRMRLPAGLQHQVQLKDNGHCQYRRPGGKLCASRRYLHIHHKLPLAQGGGNRPENLMLLCSQHHRLIHSPEMQIREYPQK